MGVGYFVNTMYKQGFPPKAQWGVDDIPDLTGRVIVVTGGYSGIGYETVKALLAHNAKVYIAGRSEEKARAAIAQLRDVTQREAVFVELDLGNLASVKRAAETLATKEPAIHVLFNNAGVMNSPVRMLTADGYDLQWGTNVLGHFYFTKLLVPLLHEGAKTSPDGHARVINTSSSTAEAGSIKFDTFRDSQARRKLGGVRLYMQSKLGSIFVANEFARRYADQGIVSCSLNPGNIRTELARHTDPVTTFFLRRIQHPAPLGALTMLWAGTSPEGLQLNGKYLWPWARVGPPPRQANKLKTQEKIWEWLEEQVRAFESSQ